MKAVLIQSEERFQSFLRKMEEYGIECVTMSFSGLEWMDFDYSTVDFLIFYPSFEFSSDHPLALYKAQDNLSHIHRSHPGLLMYPDPEIIYYYNDKYRQFLYLKQHGFPVPDTVPLVSAEAVDEADRTLGYPLVVKNRYGAGGRSVFLVRSKTELSSYERISRFDFMHRGAMRYFGRVLTSRVFLRWLIKDRNMRYPFLSPPLLAQRFIHADRDLKTVAGNGRVIEAHWRFQASKDQWKVNIDGGGIGQWSFVPDEAIALSERLARELSASWINLDLMQTRDGFVITEFSPVWHHYAYREKPSFVYKDDYNLDTPLSKSLDLERCIIESLVSKRELRDKERIIA